MLNKITIPALVFICLALLPLTSFAIDPAAVDDAEYTEVMNSDNFIMLLKYNTDHDESYLTELNQIFETSYVAFVDTYDFEAPNDGEKIKVYISNDTLGAWSNRQGYIKLADDLSGADLLNIPAHELFHQIEFQYFYSLDSFILEGLAHWAQDIVNEDFDLLESDMQFSRYWIRDLWSSTSIHRGFAVYWKYLGEQFGTEINLYDPGFGVDAIKLVMEELRDVFLDQGRAITIDDMEYYFQNNHGISSEDFYKQFLIALYGKDLNYPKISRSWSEPRISPYKFIENDISNLPDLSFFHRGDVLRNGVSLSYSNSLVDYGFGGDGFEYYGQGEPIMIELDSSVRTLWFDPGESNSGKIGFACAIHYELKTIGRPDTLRSVVSLTNSNETFIDLYSGRYNRTSLKAKYLIIIPFTLDKNPADGEGNNYSFTLEVEYAKPTVDTGYYRPNPWALLRTKI